MSAQTNQLIVSGDVAALLVGADPTAAPSIWQYKVPGTQINAWLAAGVLGAGYFLYASQKKSKRR